MRVFTGLGLMGIVDYKTKGKRLDASNNLTVLILCSTLCAFLGRGL